MFNLASFISCRTRKRCWRISALCFAKMSMGNSACNRQTIKRVFKVFILPDRDSSRPTPSLSAFFWMNNHQLRGGGVQKSHIFQGYRAARLQRRMINRRYRLFFLLLLLALLLSLFYFVLRFFFFHPKSGFSSWMNSPVSFVCWQPAVLARVFLFVFCWISPPSPFAPSTLARANKEAFHTFCSRNDTFSQFFFHVPRLQWNLPLVEICINEWLKFIDHF